MKRLLVIALAGVAFAAPAFASFIATDGDTIKFDGEKIRIIGLDTPETFRARCPEEKALGLKAKERLQELLDAGPVRLARDGKDRYKRTLAHVFIGSQPVANILIREGLGERYDCPAGRCPRRGDWCARLR